MTSLQTFVFRAAGFSASSGDSRVDSETAQTWASSPDGYRGACRHTAPAACRISSIPQNIAPNKTPKVQSRWRFVIEAGVEDRGSLPQKQETKKGKSLDMNSGSKDA